MNLADELKRRAERVERGIDLLMPADSFNPARLSQAMRYSMQGGGKRLRPVLAIAAAELWGAKGLNLDPLPAAVAIECIHTYSLIHDDLPCMDDDDFRRGRPSLHKAFDEATAVLAGDALLTLAFQLLARHYETQPAVAAGLVAELADAAGYEHLVGGQMMDLIHENSPDVTKDILNQIHARKTGAMIRASLAMGGRIGGADKAQLEHLRSAGLAIGMAFQIVDDILDATSDTATLGKTAGKDAKADKTTFVKLHGLDDARRIAAAYTGQALMHLKSLPGDTTFLVALTEDMLIRRK